MILEKTINYNNCWYVNFNIRNYKKFDDIVKIINLVDKKMIGKEKISNSNTIINIYKIASTKYDYKCITNILYSNNDILHYLSCKFIQIENIIKSYNVEFGNNWYIDFKLINFDLDNY